MAIGTDGFVVWAVDSLVKVYPEAEPGAEARVEAALCRNEYGSAQIAVRALRPVKELRVSVSEPRHASGARGVQVRPRFVGYVPVHKNTPDTPAEEFDCIAPCVVPDPLLEAETVAVAAGKNQPVWLTIFAPAEAPAGTWTATVTVEGDGRRVELPLALAVHPVTLPVEQHLWVTNWMSSPNYAKHFGTEQYSERFWQVVERFAANVAAHRQNVIATPHQLVQIFQESDGRLSFDFSRWDRWVDTFDRFGAAKLIEGGDVAHRGDGKWETPWFDWTEFPVTKRSDGSRVELEPLTVIEPLIKAVVGHVRARRLLDRYLLHVVDEPAPHTEADYKKKSALVHQWAPDARYIEAQSCADMRGYLDIWVPNINHWERDWPNYLNLRAQGGFELWFYTCMFPTGRYPNRFLDFSLLKTRLLHWINWRYRLTGYLHWGLNFWTEQPFEDDRIRESLPPGDCWIVYPGAEGPLDSLRWEQMREGLQDHELLWLLGQHAPEQADAICARMVPDPLTYKREWQELRTARAEIVEALR